VIKPVIPRLVPDILKPDISLSIKRIKSVLGFLEQIGDGRPGKIAMLLPDEIEPKWFPENVLDEI